MSARMIGTPAVSSGSRALGMLNCNNSQALLEEWKAKEAAKVVEREKQEVIYNALLKQQVALKERIDALANKDSRWWPERSNLMNQLTAVEQQIRMHTSSRDTPCAYDKFGKFCQALTDLLKACTNRTCLLSQVPENKFVQREWMDLVRSRIIRKSTEMKDVLAEKSNEFELYTDSEGRPAVRFAGETGEVTAESAINPIVPGPAPALAMAHPGIVAAGAPLPGPQVRLALTVGPGGDSANQVMFVPVHPDLRPEQVAAVESELLKAGGCERFRRIGLHCGVQETQLAKHFRLYEDQGRTMVTHWVVERSMLENMLLKLTPSRASVMETMAFCLEHAALHAARLARTLVFSLAVPDLAADKMIARLFVVSDVLFNSSSSAKGAGRFRSVFEELLPDAFENLGRQWLPSLEQGGPERDRAESFVRRVFGAWRTWDVFPLVFIGGLESLLLAPTPSQEVPSESNQAADCGDDAVLKQKLARWRSEVGPVDVKIAARRRGLSGPTLSVAACRLRLCHYERYWHCVAPDASQQEVLMLDSSGRNLANAPATDLGSAGASDAASIDGESLSDGDVMCSDEECVGPLTGRGLPIMPRGEGIYVQAIVKRPCIEQVD
mmetsp:Transcript_20177/g.55877  ORF Transcript_20177/g.55877 Transcript_20177/m.55877 type:complete len:610 (+) Transcript_20177:152-1981(+)|eukprot:CAMPEP_0117492732 /NCGR_PEP_ID=MMETSP0784-20121206/18737_1 /TAXON_ID=39447 /ORGANISM="" /LENGTH=609 /DNA_ID=CAMNT_0005287569 /DNA_START=66 /DNA_END=1895 /DNA_ORIENTATION=+